MLTFFEVVAKFHMAHKNIRDFQFPQYPVTVLIPFAWLVSAIQISMYHKSHCGFGQCIVATHDVVHLLRV